jgi:outer membrane receptor for ferrienterochelin and colicins
MLGLHAMNQTWIPSALAAAVTTLMMTTPYANTTQNAAQLSTIVVTAGGYEQNIADAAATISVITAEELNKKSYSDVTDALKNVPGVYVQGGGSNQTVMIRGMGSAYTLYMVDGKPMNDGGLLTTNGGVQGASVNFLPPIEAIERIEVIRGPSSSLYGSDAMGGVINIITKKHQDKMSASIKTEYIKADQSNKVNNDATNTSIYVNAPLVDKLLSLQVTGGLQTIDESSFQKNNTESAESDPEFKKTNLAAKLVYTPDQHNTLTFGLSNTQQERSHTPGKSMLPTSAATYSELEKKNFNLTHEGKYDHLTVNSYLQYDKDKNNATNPRTVNNIQNPGGILFETKTANTQATYFSPKNSVTVGANFKHENLEDGTTNQNASMAGQVTKMDRYQWSLFAEDTWKATDKLALTLSGRYDDNEFFGDNFSPKAYAVYNANNNFIFKGGVISGYKAPSLRDSSADYMLGSMGGAIIANPDLKPEKSLTYETGVAYENSNLGLMASLMFFKTDFKDKITTSARMEGSQEEGSQFYDDHPELPFNDRGYRYKYNVDEAEIQGLELTTDYLFNEYLKYRQSYTYTDSEQKTGENKGKPLNDMSKHMFNAGLDWDVNDQIALWTQLNYRGKTIGTSAGVQTPAYTFVDLGAVYKYDDKLQFSTGVYNIANKNVSDDGNSSVLDGRRYNFAMNLKF